MKGRMVGGTTLTDGGVVVKKGRKGRGLGFIGPGPKDNNDDGIVLGRPHGMHAAFARP